MSIAGLSLIQTLAPLMMTVVLQPEITPDELRLDRSSIDRIEQALPIVVVDRDDFEIDQSCTIRIAPGAIIPDLNNNGVIHIVSDDLIAVFEDGSVLQGRAGIDGWLSSGTGAGEGWDTLKGTAITVNGHEGVEIIGANIRGYRNGIVATDAEGLVVRDTELSDMYRQRLASTATREGSSDWLYPHNNDDNELLTNYGAAIWAERCHGAHFEGVRVRRGQNGIILDNTNGARVTKNDCSFLSGWGLAMWRASQNEITENRFDFCVRGHVEGVYNRGQDSAGILMFEACTKNLVFQNSCTHSGDGIFGFGGIDAVERAGEGPWGNANNRFISNDLSFSPAHGLEMTFSEGNFIRDNLIESNAICGIWGGYSNGMAIERNRFSTNGGMAYGSERGAINIEHGSENVICANRFENNKVGVRLWWDNDTSLLTRPGVAKHTNGVRENIIAGNRFVLHSDHPFGGGVRLIGITVEDLSDEQTSGVAHVSENAYAEPFNHWDIQDDAGVAVGERAGTQKQVNNAVYAMRRNGLYSPVPERRWPYGREWIICDQWGPWDFEVPLLRQHSRSGSSHVFEFYRPVHSDHKPKISINGVYATLTPPESHTGNRPWFLKISPRGDEPVSSYTGTVRIGDNWSRTITGRFVNAKWSVRCWAWASDPLVDIDEWRAEANAIEPVTLDQLDLPFANSGPSRVNDMLDISERDRFGLLASTEIALPKGTWKLTTLSDDGIRVFINGEMRLERWDIHGPTPDEVFFEVADDSPTRFELEYFENDGYATLKVDLQPVE